MDMRTKSGAAAIFDLDGCVCDDRWRRNRIKEGADKPEEYDHYHSGCASDAPMVEGSRMLTQHIADGDFIVFATGRPYKYSAQTSEWIQRHFRIKPNEDFVILMRHDTDGRASVTVKTEMIITIKQQMIANNLTIKAAYDDRQDVLQAYREFGFPAMLLNDAGTPPQPPQDVMDAPMKITPEAIESLMNRFGSENVEQVLQSALDTFKTRQNQYGPNDELNGKIMEILFPLGVQLRSAADFRMWHMFNHVIGKLTRFTSSGMHHHDSIHDLIVYAAFVELLADSHDIKSTFE